MTTQLAVQQTPEETAIQEVQEFTVEEVVAMTNKVKTVLAKIMVENEHYGIIPGCKKPSLWQPGAEKLCLAFRLRPEYQVTRNDLPNGHREYEARCTLIHIPTGRLFGEGIGSCSTMETKYRYRGEGRRCPTCGAEAIIKGKDEFGGGWLCFKRKGGCGAKFKDGDSDIENQEGGKVENPDIADCYNTVIQIACKRAYVKATRSSTAASDIFTDVIGDPDDPQGDATPHQESNGKPAVQQPQRKSVASNPVANGTAKAAEPTTDDAKRAELIRICAAIADARQDVVTKDYKTYTFVPAADIADPALLAAGICKTLSSFQGRDGPVAGKTAAELSGVPLTITLKKAREIEALLVAT